MFESIKRTVSSFLPSKRKETNRDVVETQSITLTPITRNRLMKETARRSYATELLDTYNGFGRTYLIDMINKTITSNNIKPQMIKVVRCLPLLKFFINSISRVYATQPNRRFYIEGKEIIKTPKESLENKIQSIKKDNINADNSNIDQESTDNEESIKPFNSQLNEDKFIYDDQLYEALNNLYNDDVILAIKQAERYTNLLNTAVYKVVTNDLGKIRIMFIPNDSVQVKVDPSDLTKAEQLAWVQDIIQDGTGNNTLVTVIENWTKDNKSVPFNASEVPNPAEDLGVNQAALKYEELFGTKQCGAAFAPFVVFRDTGSNIDFWDLKDNDVVEYIKSINMSITELRYLEKFTSFGLKYTVNIKLPEDGILDPNGIWQFATENNVVPGQEGGKNWDIGEFENKGRIDEVIKAIIFNMKMLFSMYNIPLDALISTNSVRSAENKQMDNDELFAAINSQRDVWNLNEQNLFKVMCAVHNRDNIYQIPKGIEMLVDYEEKASKEKVADDWLVEIQNNISTVLDWLSDKNPDLDRDEVMQLLKSNKAINEEQKKEPLNLNAFASVDKDGNMIIPKMPTEQQDNQSNEDNSSEEPSNPADNPNDINKNK